MGARRLVEILKEKKLIVTTAESCTGGMIASRIVDVPGASSVFRQGYITYCDEAKISLLGVHRETIYKYFAVSEQTASEMAQGGAVVAGADVCISVTGVAGPDTEDGKPVGLVYIGVYVCGNVSVKECHFTGSRAEIRTAACEEALAYAYECVLSANN